MELVNSAEVTEAEDIDKCDLCIHSPKNSGSEVFPERCGECKHFYSDNFQPLKTWECWNCGEYTDDERESCVNCGEDREK